MAPVGAADAQLLILGSLPGEASLAAQRYYAHPTNQFWRLLGQAIGDDLQRLNYEARLARLAERRIGLWDVIASARRRGSLDQAIRSPDHNQISGLVDYFRDLRAVAFNGSAAATAGRGLIGPSPPIPIIELPSSSAANTLAFDKKASAWAVLGEFLRP